MKIILVTYAVKEEHIEITLPGYEIRYICTGVGKTNAAMRLTKSIYEYAPDLVLNIGTAGTLLHKVGEIVVCTCFYDRDFQLVQLPGIDWKIDNTDKLREETLPQLLLSATEIRGSCNTGDSFVTEVTFLEGNVVDMESFAEAAVCKEFDIPFIAVKYITDKIGENSVQHWIDKLADARTELSKWFASVSIKL